MKNNTASPQANPTKYINYVTLLNQFKRKWITKGLLIELVRRRTTLIERQWATSEVIAKQITWVEE